MKKSKYQQYFLCFIVSILVSYVFWFGMYFGLATSRINYCNKHHIQKCGAYCTEGTYY